MRVLASIPALLALSGAVVAAPVASEQWPPVLPADLPTEADVQAICTQPLNATEQIPPSMILETGVVDEVFGQTTPANPLLAKRLYSRGTCFEWASWVSANARQGYYNDFQYAKAIFQGYDRFGWNYITPMQYFTWRWGSFVLQIRNQDRCSRGYWTWDDILDMMDDLWYHYCQNRGQGWGYVQWTPTLVAMIYYDGSSMPPFTPGCNHTDLKKLLKAKSEVEELEVE